MRQITSTRLARCLVAGVAMFGLFACGDDGDETFTSEDTSVPSGDTTTSPEDAGTEPFSPPEGGYSVVFPAGEPQRQEQPTPLPDGTSITAIAYLVETDERAYITAHSTFPQAPPDVQQSLEGARDGAIGNVGGTQTGSEPIELQGVPGIEFSAAVTSNGVEGTYIARIYQDGDQQFQVAVTGAGTFDASDEQVQAFFDSYAFVE